VKGIKKSEIWPQFSTPIAIKALWLDRPTLVGKALSFTREISFSFFFYKFTVLSSHAEDGH